MTPQLLHFWKNAPPLALLTHGSPKTLTGSHLPVFLTVGRVPSWALSVLCLRSPLADVFFMTKNEIPSLKPLTFYRADKRWPLRVLDKPQGGGGESFLASRSPTTSGDSLALPSSLGPLTEARGGDGVHVDLVIADLLVALSVGCGLREGGALAAMAPGDLVHALHHAGLKALPTGRGALPETGTV